MTCAKTPSNFTSKNSLHRRASRKSSMYSKKEIPVAKAEQHATQSLYEWRSFSLSWCRIPVWDRDHMQVRGLKLHAVQNWDPSLRIRRVCSLPEIAVFPSYGHLQLLLCTKIVTLKKSPRYTHGHYQAWLRRAHYASSSSAFAITAAQSLQR